MRHMPFVMQVVFFGALLSAIKSCASATLLAPSVTFTENIWSAISPFKDDHARLSAMRITVLCFSCAVLGYSIFMHGTPIYELVSGAYQVTLVGAFVPLLAGLYWERASTQGALCSIGLGLTGWILFLTTSLGDVFPAQLVGLGAATFGMVIGSLCPQIMKTSEAVPHDSTPTLLGSGEPNITLPSKSPLAMNGDVKQSREAGERHSRSAEADNVKALG
jgi:Na+/proline symporter